MNGVGPMGEAVAIVATLEHCLVLNLRTRMVLKPLSMLASRQTSVARS